MKRTLLALSLAAPALCLAKSPPCSHWPMKMAESVLTEAGITGPEKLDDAKTTAVRLASEQIGKDLYQQVYRITFQEKTGQSIEVVTNSQASSKECSMGSVDVFVVSKQFNSDAPIKNASP